MGHLTARANTNYRKARLSQLTDVRLLVRALARRLHRVLAQVSEPLEATIQISPIAVIIVPEESAVLVPVLAPFSHHRTQASEETSDFRPL